jgi:hypothetical protein
MAVTVKNNHYVLHKHFLIKGFAVRSIVFFLGIFFWGVLPAAEAEWLLVFFSFTPVYMVIFHNKIRFGMSC